MVHIKYQGKVSLMTGLPFSRGWNFFEVFPFSSPELISLCQNMLRFKSYHLSILNFYSFNLSFFSPVKRTHPMEALQDSIFDEVRVMELEDSCDTDADIDLTLLEVLFGMF